MFQKDVEGQKMRNAMQILENSQPELLLQTRTHICTFKYIKIIV